MKLLGEPLGHPGPLAGHLADTPAKLQQVSAEQIHRVNDGAGTTVASWEFVILKSPRLNVLLCELDYTSPRGNAQVVRAGSC